ncbi:MAG: carbohydrate binding domain-containing protein [Sedimentisphaerales bacterium]
MSAESKAKNRKSDFFTFTICLSVLMSLFVCKQTAADSFVPFVIPAKPSAESPIAVTSYEPIGTASSRLVVRSNHFYCGNKRVRLWGVNLSFGANLPRHEDAAYIAARLAAAGVNAVRCHHMDTARWPRGLWNAEDGKSISSEALDRLDFFLDQLARHGIWVNINLHVGREHSQYLGLPETNRNYDKISNIFTPALIDAQKQYARDLLTHVNRYRKVRYADDPAVAIVEITNENSFFMWGSYQTLRTLPAYYANILHDRFNTWLKNRYGSTDALRAVWSEGAQPLGANLLTNGKFEVISSSGVPQNWYLEQHAGCRASLSRYRYQGRVGLRIEINKADETGWHLQLNQRGLSVKAGQYYTVIFQAASDMPRQINCNVGQAHSPWKNLGLSKDIELTNQWQSFRFGFVAKADDDNARVNFSLGGSGVTVYLANVEFRPGGQVILQRGESIEAGSIALFADNETLARTVDRMCFLAETEKDYFDGMRNFIKNDIGCQALVTGTIIFGPLGLYAQSDMDFIDTHAYWQHPRFPGRPWDRNNWYVEQKAMTDHPSQATLFSLAAKRLAGKPFTCSEYNHPAPLDYQAECVPMIASFAAAQDWDGVWLYTYSHSSDEWYREHLNSYFDIDTNPAKWGFMRAGTAIFRDYAISQLSNFAVVALTDSVDILSSLANLHLEYDRDIFGILGQRAAIGWQDMLAQQIFLTLSGQIQKQDFSDEPGLAWSVVEGKGFYAARSLSTWCYTGHAERFEEATDGQIVVAGPTFIAMTITALDKAPLNQSRKVLITACGRCENTGMIFSRDRQTVGTNWGGPPVQIEAVEGILHLPLGRWICHALGPDGLPSYNVPVSYQADSSTIELLPKYETMWYLLTR